MIILARVTNVLQNRRARLKGYELGWFLSDQLVCKITGAAQESRSRVDGNAVDGSAKILDGGRFETLKIAKLLDGATPILMFKNFVGELIREIEIQVAETFATCRFLHYFKCEVRDKIGGSMTRDSMQAWLNKRIKQYVEPNPNNASETAKAMRPLALAEVVVGEDESNPGYYRSKFFLKPHYQLEGLTVSRRLVSKPPSGRTSASFPEPSGGHPLTVPHFFTCYRASS